MRRWPNESGSAVGDGLRQVERLGLNASTRYSAVEAAIHLARYAVAAPYCRGMRVLDIACGEGYGSRFLASQGATEVIGVEVDAETVERASERFGGDRVSFRCADAGRIDELFTRAEFDLVVSLETVEHLDDPEGFLRGLRSVARKEATLILSCPNDHWYFPEPGDRNPFHVRKYHFEEFRQMSEAILGPTDHWLLGAPVMGFGTMALNRLEGTGRDPTQLRMTDYSAMDAAFVVPAEDDLHPTLGNGSYFVGIWSMGSRRDRQPTGSAVVYPLSMDAFHPAFQPLYCRALEAQRQELEARVASLESSLAVTRRLQGMLPRWLLEAIKPVFARLTSKRTR